MEVIRVVIMACVCVLGMQHVAPGMQVTPGGQPAPSATVPSQQPPAVSLKEARTNDTNANRSINYAVVVLKNGQAIDGDVEKIENRVSIHVPSGSRIVLDASQVSFTCDSFQSAYWELSARTKSSNVEGQIRIFRWCIQHQLLQEASNHLLVLQEMKIPAARMVSLDESLRFAETQSRQRKLARQKRQAEQEKQTRLAEIALAKKQRVDQLVGETTVKIPNLHPDVQIASNAVRTDRLQTAARRLEKKQKPAVVQPLHSASYPVINADGEVISVRQVNYEELAESDSASGGSKTQAALPAKVPPAKKLAHWEVEQTLRSMPPGAWGVFKSEVEPLMTQSCAACHHQDATDTGLHFRLPESGTSRKDSRHNLGVLIPQIDRVKIADSELWKKTVTAHGSLNRPPVEPNSPTLQGLKQWLISISQNPYQSTDVFQSPELEGSSTQSPGQAADNIDGQSDGPRQNPPVKPVASPAVIGTDEFDPEIFNRQFR